MGKNVFVLENRFNKILSLIIYCVVLVFILIIYTATYFFSNTLAQYAAVFVSVFLSLLLIFYRARIIHYITEIILDRNVQVAKKRNRANLNRTISGLRPKQNYMKNKHMKLKEKINSMKTKSKIKAATKQSKIKDKYYEIKG